MFQDPIFIAFIIFVALNALILLMVWWLTIRSLVEFTRS
jgi:hypothetical protein